MPTYEYICDACGHEFEKEQRITEDPIKKCPQCRKAKARRMIGGGNFILKGDGWYSDLYSGPSNRKAGDAKADTGDAPAKKDSKKGSKKKNEPPPSAAAAE